MMAKEAAARASSDSAPPSPPTNVDRFEVKISRVRGELRTAEARPVFLSFDFDNGFWKKETDVHEGDVNPVWGFAPKVPSSSSSSSVDARFLYKTEFAHRFHKKYLAVTLSERSPNGDVAWGTGTVSLDSLVYGCENVALNMIAPDDVTCYGTIRFNISIVNIAEVTAHLSELKLMNYSNRFLHDVKLVYFEFGLSGFEKGYRHCTERCSDAEPHFYSRPALKRDCKLRDMVSPSPTSQGPMRILFSVHRQVARNRTEEIGLGALPVRMLFRKVHNGYMEVPTKFKVPLQNNRGVLKGKVLLRNIPRFHQLPGDDLVNVNGVITPIDEDLNQRKIVPWMRLPKPLVPLVNNKSPANTMTVTSGYLGQGRDSKTTTANGLPPDRNQLSGYTSKPPVSPLTSVAFSYDLPDGIANLTLSGGEYSADANDPLFAQPNSGYSVGGPSDSGTMTPVQRSKSGKSCASYGTIDGGVEIGSVLNSVTSDDGLHSSRHSAPSPMDLVGDSEWVAVEDPSTHLFYFASKITHESLWLPPDWERELDSDGRYIFVDYNSGAKQYWFPADEARRYRESVYTQQ